jgi:peptidoglycan/xylan/chitin deacetylase (PgdA/CDA1 family)
MLMLVRSIDNAVRRQVLAALSYTGIDRLLAPVFGGVGSIVMLHRVAESTSNVLGGLTISVALLDRFIRYVRRSGYDIVTLDDVYRGLQLGCRDRRFICFTFDDGYADNYALALPIFRRHGIPMTIYVASGFIDRSASYWWGALEQVLLRNDQVTISDGASSSIYALRTFAEKNAAYDALTARAHRDMHAFLPVLEDLFRRSKVNPVDVLDQAALTICQARELAAEPLVEIGAHGLTHRPLSHLAFDEARREIVESRAKLQDWLEAEVSHFAYPYGSPRDCGNREFVLTREAGFRTATTTRDGNVYARNQHDLFSLPRLAMGEEWHKARMFALQLSGTVSALRNGLSYGQ